MPDTDATIYQGPDKEGATVSLTPPPPAPASPAAASDDVSMTMGTGKKALGLATKYFLMAATLILITIGSAVAITAYRANVVADRTIRAALASVEKVFASFEAERGNKLRTTIRTRAEDAGTKALLASADVTPETVMVWTQDNTKVLGADFLAVLDRNGAIIARNDKPLEEVNGRSVAHAKFVQESMMGMDSAALVKDGSKVYTVAAAPVYSGEGTDRQFVGVIFAGYPLNDEAAKNMATLSGGGATFLVNTGKDGAVKAELLASTAPSGAELLDAFQAATGVTDKLFAKGDTVGPVDIYPGSDHVIAVGFPLKTGSGDVIGAFVSSRSVSEAKAAFNEIRNTLLVVGLLSLIFAIPASYMFGKRIAQPLMTLAASANAVREGDLDVILPPVGGDEVGILAGSFAKMISELKEKAELEKFVMGLGVSAEDVTHGKVTAEQHVETLGTPPKQPLTATGAIAAKKAAAEVNLKVGSTLGDRYEIDALIGQGGMGAVWRAQDKELEELVALKVIRNDVLASNPQITSQLKEEIKLARRITHPNILRTHDFGDADGVRFISMEFVPGPTLRHVIDKRGPLSLPAGLQIGRQICRGLAAAHDAGIVHRDIKPHNIIIAPNGVVKIMDFGIAFSQEKHEAMSGGGVVVGTPDYMSPEQIEGKSVDARADIYAVGIVLYEMFTGVRPFHTTTTVQTLMRNMTVTPTPIRQLRPDMPEALEALIAQASAKKPEERIQTANDLRRALGKISS
ncbi:MAG: protein kinase [Acidobacteriota bacterium]